MSGEVTLLVGDGGEVSCPVSVAQKCGLLSAGEEGIVAGQRLECAEVGDAAVVEQVVDFGKVLVDDATGEFDVEKVDRPLRSATLTENGIPEWIDAHFKAKEHEQLFSIFKAAHRLKFRTLAETCAIIIAHRIHAMEGSAFEATFKLSREYTPEEEALIRDMYNFGDDD